MRKILFVAAAALSIGALSACGDSDLDVGEVVDAVDEVVTSETAESADTTAATTTEAPAPTTSEAPEPTEAPTTTEAPATADAIEPSAYPVTAESSADDIALLQQALVDAGYDLLESGVNGQWGAETAAAAATAAVDAGLDPAAGVTAELWAALQG